MSVTNLPDGHRAFGRGLELRLRPELALQPVLHHGLGHHPDIQLRVEAPANALDHHHGLLEEKQLWPRLHVEHFGILEELAEQLRHGDFTRRPIHDRLSDGAQSLGEQLDGMLARHVASLEMHLRYAPVVARDEAV